MNTNNTTTDTTNKNKEDHKKNMTESERKHMESKQGEKATASSSK